MWLLYQRIILVTSDSRFLFLKYFIEVWLTCKSVYVKSVYVKSGGSLNEKGYPQALMCEHLVRNWWHVRENFWKLLEFEHCWRKYPSVLGTGWKGCSSTPLPVCCFLKLKMWLLNFLFWPPAAMPPLPIIHSCPQNISHTHTHKILFYCFWLWCFIIRTEK